MSANTYELNNEDANRNTIASKINRDGMFTQKVFLDNFSQRSLYFIPDSKTKTYNSHPKWQCVYVPESNLPTKQKKPDKIQQTFARLPSSPGWTVLGHPDIDSRYCDNHID